MSKRIQRFKLCDLRFHPYLKSVIERLPEEVREIVLNDMSFQILTDDDIFEACVLRYEFGAPVRNLVYLNTKILREPDHQIIHTIASEMAHYILKKQDTHEWERKLDNLLIEWGFGKEVAAVRYDQVISKSEGYKIGYDWAKKQNLDYLRQHFFAADFKIDFFHLCYHPWLVKYELVPKVSRVFFSPLNGSGLLFIFPLNYLSQFKRGST